MKQQIIKALFLSVAMITFFASCEKEKEEVKIPDISGIYEMTMKGIIVKSTQKAGETYNTDSKLCVYKIEDNIYGAAYCIRDDSLAFPLKDVSFIRINKDNEVKGVVPYFIDREIFHPVHFEQVYKEINISGYFSNAVISGEYLGYARTGSGSMIGPYVPIRAYGKFEMRKIGEISDQYKEQIERRNDI